MRSDVRELIERLGSFHESQNHDLVYELCIATRPRTFLELLEMLPRTPNKTIIDGWMEYQSRPAMATSQETDLYAAIADALGEHGHTVYVNQAISSRPDLPVFSVSGTGGNRPDLYVTTSLRWPHHELIPALIIEAKCAAGKKSGAVLGWVTSAFEQMRRYLDDERARYYSKRTSIRLQDPVIGLVATDDSLATGHLYRWKPGGHVSPETYPGGWTLLTEFANRALAWRNGCAILQGTSFQTNAFAPQAPRYDLSDFRAAGVA